jgi:ABC-type uncharacterized transport system involved in gliding motility auxiliary subunit
MKLAHWGRILGPVGGVFLAVSVLTLLLAGDSWLGMINILLGVACVTFALVTNFGNLAQAASGRGTFYTLVSAASTLVLLLALIASNYLAATHEKSWDVTREKINTLSDDTEKTLQGLTAPVEVLAFFKTGEPGRAPFEELFARYHARSDRFAFRFLDPDREPQLVKSFALRTNGPRVVVKLGQSDARVSEASEEELTNALIQVTHATRKKIYFTSGHGESELSEKGAGGLALLAERMLTEGLQPQQLPFGAPIPEDAAAVVVAGPEKPLLPAEVETLSTYLAQGGRVLALLEPLSPSGLEKLTHAYGITIDEGIIVDQAGRGQFDDAFAAVGLSYTQHPVVKQFKLVTVFPRAASLSVQSVDGAEAMPLVLTLGETNGAQVSWLERSLQASKTPEGGAKLGPLTVAAASSKPSTPGSTPHRSDQARLIVVGDHDFATNGYLAAQGIGDGDFALNSLNWLVDQVERVTIRPRQREGSRLFLTASQMGAIRFFATELPIGLLALGLAIFFNRRAK